MIKSYCGLSDLALTIQLREIEPDQIENFWMHVSPGALIVLDEIHKWFSSREWKTVKNNQFGFWASTHRHQGFDVILITQSMDRVDSAVRSLLEWTYVFRKVNFFGGAVQKKYICYSYGGENTGSSPLAKDVRTYLPNVFLCYKSYVSKDVKELGIMQHVNVLKHPVFFAIPIVFFFTLYMVFGKSSIASGDLFGAKQATTSFAQKKSSTQKTASKSETSSTRLSAIMPTERAGQIVYSNRK
jgi:zona occludens toxin (predicted ATPase)